MVAPCSVSAEYTWLAGREKGPWSPLATVSAEFSLPLLAAGRRWPQPDQAHRPPSLGTVASRSSPIPTAG